MGLPVFVFEPVAPGLRMVGKSSRFTAFRLLFRIGNLGSFVNLKDLTPILMIGATAI